MRKFGRTEESKDIATPVYTGVGFDVFPDKTTGSYWLVKLEYNFDTGEARVASKLNMTEGMAVVSSVVEKIVRAKVFALPIEAKQWTRS